MESYIFHCYQNGNSNGQAMSAYSALTFWAKLEAVPLNFDPTILMALHGFKRIYKRQKPARWVTLSDLQALLNLWSEVQLTNWTLLVVSFFTLVHPAEILSLAWGHLFFQEKYIYLPWSKNDPEGEGTYVTMLDPVLEVLTRYRASLPSNPVATDLVFPSINQATLNNWLDSVCKHAGVGPYTWYHLKHGGATHFAIQGWSFERIKAHGRWKSDTAARLYIHAPTKQ
eukprot:Phypoly_transcript_12176.p2 GENE.Phypoly_transcript_12176~~Phypoly_transcript_12176.p2  ORF type:complete len:227 (-),score=29.67 Phypoly_transcript_12176:61-741(-)